MKHTWCNKSSSSLRQSRKVKNWTDRKYCSNNRQSLISRSDMYVLLWTSNSYISIYLNIFKNLQYNFHWCCFLQMGGMPPQMHMQHDPLHHQMAHQMPPGYGHVMPPDQAQQIFPPQDIDERPHLPPVPPPDEEDDQRDRRDREDRRHRRSRHDRSRSRSVKDTRDVHNFKMMFLDRLFLLFLHLTC